MTPLEALAAAKTTLPQRIERDQNLSRSTAQPWGSAKVIGQETPAYRIPFVPPSITPTIPGSSKVPALPFELVNATTGGVLKIKVTDGKVNKAFPSGMGFNNYVLNLVEESFQEVYLIITYDEDNLSITSRTLGMSDSPPDSTPGTLIISIGSITITYDANSNPIVTPANDAVGNIQFAFVYGAYNGEPALLPVNVYADWVLLAEV